MKAAVVGLIGLGFALLIASLAWSTMFPATSSWTPDKEQRWTDVKRKIHNLSFVVASTKPASMHGGPDPAQAKAEYDTLQKENAELAADFKSAAMTPQTVSKYLKWSGISIAVVGLIGWYAVKNIS